MLDGVPLVLIEKQTNKNPSMAWKALCNRYKPNTVKAYTWTMKEMESCMLENAKDDPKEWIQKINCCFNTRLATIEGRITVYLKLFEE